MSFPDPLSPGTEIDAGNEAAVSVFRMAIEEKSVWAGLYDGIRDALFPTRLPPLELTSAPVPVPDRMNVKTSRWALGTSTIVNGGALAVVLLMSIRMVAPPGPITGRTDHIHLRDLTIFAPRSEHAGSSGGGANEMMDPTAGNPPRFEKTPLTPPQAPLLNDPKLAINPAVAAPPDIRLPENPLLPSIGVQNYTRVTWSNGPGTEAGMGTGQGGGSGPGKGNGWGPGDTPGVGVLHPGIGGVSNPVAIVTPEAEFSDEARRMKYQGICMVAIIVDAHGYPQNPRVVRSLGMGLDEKALDAVRRYRFKPAMKDGRPVPVAITVAVDFRLY